MYGFKRDTDKDLDKDTVWKMITMIVMKINNSDMMS